MSTRVFILGYGKNPLNADEQNKLDEHVAKWKNESWSQDSYGPFDQRDKRFEEVQLTYEGEADRPDGKKVVIYDDISVAQDSDVDKILSAFNELKAELPSITFEAHTEEKQLA
jgi:hypothetical protein